MKREDIILGAKVYVASIVEPPTMERPAQVLVDEYTVTQAGKTKFEISGRGRRGGYYDNNTLLVDSMQFSPAGAVEWLEKRRKQEVEHAKRSLERAQQLLDEDLRAIQEWRNKRGL